jgi:phosphohistidine phosphatase
MYEAGAATLLRVLKSATEDVVLMIAHNPGIAMFASQLVNVAPDHPRFRDYPTGATTVIQFEKDSWLNVLKGDVAAFVTPRELVG